MTSQNIEVSLEKLFKHYQRELNTGIPCYVEKYDDDACTVDVTVPFSDYYEQDGAEPLNLDWGVIPDVPVQFPGSGEFSITWPLKRGDVGWLKFSQRSLDEWFASDGNTLVTPTLQTMHSEGDCVFEPVSSFPQGRIKAKRDKQHVWIQYSGTIKMKADRVEIGETDSPEALAKASKTDSNDNKLNQGLTEVRLIFGLPPAGIMDSAACSKVFGG